MVLLWVLSTSKICSCMILSCAFAIHVLRTVYTFGFLLFISSSRSNASYKWPLTSNSSAWSSFINWLNSSDLVDEMYFMETLPIKANLMKESDWPQMKFHIELLGTRISNWADFLALAKALIKFCTVGKPSLLWSLIYLVKAVVRGSPWSLLNSSKIIFLTSSCLLGNLSFCNSSCRM